MLRFASDELEGMGVHHKVTEEHSHTGTIDQLHCALRTSAVALCISGQRTTEATVARSVPQLSYHCVCGHVEGMQRDAGIEGRVSVRCALYNSQC